MHNLRSSIEEISRHPNKAFQLKGVLRDYRLRKIYARGHGCAVWKHNLYTVPVNLRNAGSNDIPII